MLQYIVAGLALGGVYAMISAALVFTYSSTGVLNFALGAMAYSIARVYNFLLVQEHWPIAAAAVLSILVIAPLLGIFLWAILFRAISKCTAIIKVVVTIGVAVALPAVVTLIFGTQEIINVPGLAPVPVKVYSIIGVPVDLDTLITIGSVIVLGVVSFAILRFTSFGLKIRGFVDSEAMTSISGTNQHFLAMSVWAIGTFVAGLAGVLIAPDVGLAGPDNYTLLLASAFAAALIARLRYSGRAAVGGILLGVATVLAERYLPAGSTWTTGIVNSIPFGFIVVTLLVYAVFNRLPEETEVGGPIDRAIAPVGSSTQFGSSGARPHADVPAARASRLRDPALWGPLAVMAVIFILPLVLGGSWVGLVGLGLAFGVAFLGYTLVSGEGGMIWLCLISFAGLGAVFTAQFATVFGLPSMLALLLGAATAIPPGLLIGVLALRIGDLYLALITLTVGLLMDNLIFSINRFVNFGAGVFLNRPSFALSDRTFTYFVFVVFCIVALVVWNIRKSTTGLAMSAVRGSTQAAATVGISVFWMKVFISVIGAFVAALGGGLIAMYGEAALPASFAALGGLVWLAVLVTTGVRSNIAAALAGLTFALLPAVFSTYLPTAISALPTAMFGIGAIMVVHNPDGALAMNARQLQSVVARAAAWVRHRAAQPTAVGGTVTGDTLGVAATVLIPAPDDQGESPALTMASHGQAGAAQSPPAESVAATAGAPRDVVLAASGIGVRFGGVTALSDVSIEVRAGQIVGLVGPNGAGKSTLFAVLSGFLRNHAGTVQLNGKDVTGLRPERRARSGLARTFQQPELFPALTVRQHLVLADRIRHSYGRLFRDALNVRGTRRGSREENDRVDALLEVLGLGGIADRLAAGLPTGLSRLVEIGRALATDPTVVLLDEPTAGLDPQESAQLGRALRQIADQRQTSLLLVEHDLDHVLAVSDYIYVLDFGVLIAAGLPSAIRTDALVRSAYMGTESLTGAPTP